MSAETVGAMSLEQAMQKAAKLLRLAESKNPHEAALAAAKAQEIMDRYKIQNLATGIEWGNEQTKEPIRDYESDPLDASCSRLSTWRYALADIIATYNKATVYRIRGTICLIGRGSDVAVVRYIYGYLVREMERLVKRDCPGKGRIYSNNFRLGVIDAVNQELFRRQAETEASMRDEANRDSAGRELAVLNAIEIRKKEMDEVEAFTNGLGIKENRSSSQTMDYCARMAGKRAGAEISLGGAKADLPDATGKLEAMAEGRAA